MTANIAVLHLEDNATDSELIREALHGEPGRYESFWVQCAQDFLCCAAHATFDIILCDFNLHGYDGSQL